jgi:hypothetical protein
MKKNLREMDRDKQSSKHAFGAWSDDPTNMLVGGSLAVHRSVLLVQLPDDLLDVPLDGNGSQRKESEQKRKERAPHEDRHGAARQMVPYGMP